MGIRKQPAHDFSIAQSKRPRTDSGVEVTEGSKVSEVPEGSEVPRVPVALLQANAPLVPAVPWTGRQGRLVQAEVPKIS